MKIFAIIPILNKFDFQHKKIKIYCLLKSQFPLKYSIIDFSSAKNSNLLFKKFLSTFKQQKIEIQQKRSICLFDIQYDRINLPLKHIQTLAEID